MKSIFKNPWFWASLTLVAILGGSLFVFNPQSPSSGGTAASSAGSTGGNSAKPTPLSGVEISPASPFDLGEVSMKKGIVTQVFNLKNNSGKELKVSKFETSCMCTEASLKIGDKESPYFSMPGHSFNPGWQADFAKDSQASLTIRFDPNAHGPDAVGPISRVVRIFFSDPSNTYLDINFSANVVK